MVAVSLPLGATPSLVARVQEAVSRELRNSALRPCVVCGCDARDGLECEVPPPPPAPVADNARRPLRALPAVARVALPVGVALFSLPAGLAAAGAVALGRAVMGRAGRQARQQAQPAQHAPPEPPAPAAPPPPRHFTCADCLNGYLLHACTPGEGGGVVIQTGELLPPCAAGQAAFLPAAPPGAQGAQAAAPRSCDAPPYSRRVLAAAASVNAFASFERAREAWVQNRAAEEALAVATARAAAEAAAGAVQRHVTFISEQILTAKCPKCSTAFVDFEGCFALTCGRRECEETFCGWCLAGFGRDRAATHAHALECPQSLNRGSYFGTEQQFAQALRTRALEAIPRYLDVAVGPRGAEADGGGDRGFEFGFGGPFGIRVNRIGGGGGNANARLRDQVVERLRPMLRMHNIEPRQVR